LNDVESRALFANGHLLYARQNTLMAQPFDLGNLTVSGPAVPIVEHVMISDGLVVDASVSNSGTIAYIRDSGTAASVLAWVDRTGKVMTLVGQSGVANLRNIWLAADDSQAVVDVRNSATSSDVWRIDLARQIASRFTFGGALNSDPVFSRDGQYVAFDRNTDSGLYRKRADGSGGEELLAKIGVQARPRDFSPDGRLLMFDRYEPGAADVDIWALPLVGERKPFVVVAGPGQQSNERISPDGRWMAYTSAESGQLEIFVTSFPHVAGKWQISSGEADEPRWRSDGKELFFLSAAGNKMMATAVTTGPQFSAGAAQPLFDIPMGYAGGITARYGVSRDGQRFLMNVPDPASQHAPVDLVLNWPALLKK
jgi:Tol biopolymer transport system component